MQVGHSSDHIRVQRHVIDQLRSFPRDARGATPPAGVSPALAAMWHEAKGDWAAAHRLAQAEDDADGAWVHAYLHRVEGDLANAGYWYRRAGKPASEQPLRRRVGHDRQNPARGVNAASLIVHLDEHLISSWAAGTVSTAGHHGLRRLVIDMAWEYHRRAGRALSGGET